MRLIQLLTFLSISFSTLSQGLIPEGNSEKLFFDDFTEKSEKWPSITDKTDIHLSYDDGDYLVSRKNPSKPYAVQPNYSAINRNFILKTAFKMGPVTNTESTLGIFIMLQSQLSGGLIIEFNRKNSFRIKEFSDGSFIYHSGDINKDGWEKAKTIGGINSLNKIKIVAYAGKYEFWCNKILLKSINVDSYKKGDFGLWIGPDAIGKFDYFYLYNLKIESQPDFIPEEMSHEITSLKRSNDSLKQEIAKLKYGDSDETMDAIVAIQILEKQISLIQGEKKALQSQVDEIMNSSESGAIDLINKMTHDLSKANIEKDSLRSINQELLSRIDVLQEEFFVSKTKYSQLEKEYNILLEQQSISSDDIQDITYEKTEESPKNEEIKKELITSDQYNDELLVKKVKVKTAIKKNNQ